MYKAEREKRFVICGSMNFYNTMLEIKNILEVNNIPIIIPNKDDLSNLFSKKEYEMYKRSASRKHIQEIRRKETLGIIIINNEKHQIKNYIGGNTFAEIAIAFSHSKKIFILNEFPDFFLDELQSWGAIELRGCLDPIIELYRSLDDRQPTLFD